MLQALKGMIFEEDQSKTAAARPATISIAPTSPTAAPTDLAANNEFVDLLRKAIMSRNTAFTSLLSAADKLNGVIPDSNMRIKAAYQMVKSEGRGLNEVLQAIEIHANDLASQERQFNVAAEQALSVATGAMQRELDTLGPNSDSARAQIESLQQQIANLNSVIANNTVRQSELTGKIAEEKAHFEASKIKFASALAAVQAELQSQKTVISTTLA